MTDNYFQIGDIVRVTVTGEYCIDVQVTGTIRGFYADNRIKIATPQGYHYMVHRDDTYLVARHTKIPIVDKSSADLQEAVA